MTGIFAFDHDHGAAARDLSTLLGGKGAGLAEMTAALGISVPPGFTISVPMCCAYRESGWPEGLDEALAEHMERLGERMGRRFGDPADPLLVAVRSGAPVSMPGMLDTVLNLGLNDETVVGLERVSGDAWFARDSYHRFLTMFAGTVMGVEGLDIEEIKARVPRDPMVQLRQAVEAVFRSWDSDRARAYRAKEGIDDSLGTAVSVQAMVFGNRGERSGTGVVFTRDPATGEPGAYGDYLPRAQGEDVVAGNAKTLPIDGLADHEPAAYAELMTLLRRLEIHYRDICDVEFTVEEGRLWLLQTRIGKRGAVAAVRIAAHLVDDPDIRLTPEEALDRVPPDVRERARNELLSGDDGADDQLLVTGLPASPGRVTGRVVLSAEEALDADDDVILVRPETNPKDVAGMSVSVGVLTTKGGLVSHAAVVARGWGIPAVVGAHELQPGVTVRAGDVITIDGTSGKVWRGEVAAAGGDLEVELPELARLEAWARV
jgi:pyruvate, orthophosphate dikinase